MAIVNSDINEWWDLEESSGNRTGEKASTVLVDNNTVGSTTGIVGNAGLFAGGSTEFLSLADASAGVVKGGDTDWGFAVWFYPTTSTTQAIFARDDSGTGDRDYILYLTGAEAMKWQVYDGGTTSIALHTPSGTATLNAWNFLYVYHSATNNELGSSFNGGTITTTSTTGAAGNGTVDFQVGARQTSASRIPFYGRIDELTVFNRTLTQTEVNDLYNSGSGRTYSDYAGGGATFTPRVMFF